MTLPENSPVVVVGGGLAGSEAAWQLARRGHRVRLVEKRPGVPSPAHRSGDLGELVCSNSLGSDELTSPGGILKAELRRLGSLVLACADASAVPAGGALAVDREQFARRITEKLSSHPLVEIRREECPNIPPEPCIVATGPLTDGGVAAELQRRVGGFLSFYDAVSPVVTAESLDSEVVFRASRWGKGEDYLNCPMDIPTYQRFLEALLKAERAPLHQVDQKPAYFEGCLPVEVIASRGEDTLRFGPLRPVGLPDPRTGHEPYAVVQLRQENREGTLYNLVGFQTNLRWGEQERVFRLIPGLERAEFVRLGVMHRNSFVRAPMVLDSLLRLRNGGNCFLAGQLCGVEGYVESTAMGLVAALHLSALLFGDPVPPWPRETAVGGLLAHLQEAPPEHFQPMNCNLGIFPPLERRVKARADRCLAVANRSRDALEAFLRGEGARWHVPEKNV